MILITGASNGIGKAVALTLANEGATLALCWRADAAGIEDTLAQVTARGATAKAFQADFAIPGAATAVFEKARDWGGVPRVVINNAGPGRVTPLGPDLAQETMQLMQVNVAAPLEIIAAAAPDMTSGGVILNISSLNGRLPPARVTGFAASKAALDAATLALAQELGPRGIRVLGLAPGPIERDDAPRPDDIRLKIQEKTALPRFGTVQDVADMVAFLVSDAAGFVTGEIIGLHGGWN